MTDAPVEVTIRVLCAAADRHIVIDSLDVHMWGLQSLATWLGARGGTVQLEVGGEILPEPAPPLFPDRYAGPTLTASQAFSLRGQRAVYIGFDRERRERVAILGVQLHGVRVRFLDEDYIDVVAADQLAAEADVALERSPVPPSRLRRASAAG